MCTNPDHRRENLLNPLKATAPPGRLGPRASVANIRLPTDAIGKIRPTGWLRKIHLFHLEQVGWVET